MAFLDRLTNFFSRNGREQNLLRQGLEQASADQPAKAIEVYDTLVHSESTAIRSQALFNRALAYSALKEDEKAIVDLERVVAMPGVAENVLNAAKTQLARVRSRTERKRTRAEQIQTRQGH
jgi:hypothetical protein